MTRSNVKILQNRYEQIASLPDEQHMYCLSKTTQQMLLNMTAYLHWRTRWSGAVDNNQIDEWASKAVWELTNECGCECVAECITSSDAVKAAITKVLNDGGIGNPTGEEPISDDILEEPLVVIPECNNDKLWGACIEVVDGIFDTTFEVLQRISLSGDTLDLIGEMLELIPIVGKYAGSYLRIYDWVTDFAMNLFEAVDGTVVREEIACLLFCKCSVDCNVTFERIEETFVESSIEEPPNFLHLWDQLQWLMDLALSGNPNTKIAATINFFGVLVLKYGGSFGANELSVHTLGQMISLGAKNRASDDWTILCDTCPVLYDRLGGDGTTNMSLIQMPLPWPYDVTGTYVSELDHYRGAADKNTSEISYYCLAFEFDFGTPTNVTALTMDSSYHSTRVGSYIEIWLDGILYHTENPAVVTQATLLKTSLSNLGLVSVIQVRWMCSVSLTTHVGNIDVLKFDLEV